MFKKNLIHWLIPVVVVCFIAATFVFVVNAGAAQAENEPIIHYVVRGENGFGGHVFTDKDGYYIRATLFYKDNYYFIVVIPVGENGVWELLIRGDVEHASLQVVDRPDAFVPGEYIVYDCMGIDFID